MFTGLIEEVGKITKIQGIPGGKKLRILASKIMDDIKVDDSVAVNGVCLTATKIETDGFWADAVGETLNKTTLAFINENTFVNLERAMKVSDRLGGHIVQGHIGGIGEIIQILNPGDNYILECLVPEKLAKYIIDEGSITLNGISLTVAKINDCRITVSVIPHTWEMTNLKYLSSGSKINIEPDVIAKYLEKLLFSNKNDKEKFTDDWFKKLGY